MDLLRPRRRPPAPVRFDARVVEAAGALVARTLRQRGLSPLLATGSTVAVAIPDRYPTTLAGVPAVPLTGHEVTTVGVLEQALHARGVTAQVTVVRLPDPAPRIVFATPGDARAFAQLVERELTDDQRAAGRLRAALHSAGITTAAPDAVLGMVTIGAVSLPEARLLYQLLGGRTAGLPEHTWRHAPVLTTWLASALVAVLPDGPPVRVEAEPGGEDCCEPRIVLGEATPERAGHLAGAVEAATRRLLLPAGPASRTGARA
ncbi:hypothetical protein ACFVIM_23645 [Streptomyces sp. NPDC057638]|uniref:hypothetical protein n=1 Tax=Streptomyces sp. NPDC057638 TaxID=3346190 RepID=UPI0036B60991